MPNFNRIGFICIAFTLSGCLDLTQEQFFSTTAINQESQTMEYQDIHKLNLAISMLHKEVDESGFSPKLKSNFELNNLNEGPWAQAWVAFNINIFINDEKIASLTKADVMQNHRLNVEFEQHLPKFGITQNELRIRVSPIAWMPTYPLQILPQSKDEKTSSTKQNIKKNKNAVSSLP